MNWRHGGSKNIQYSCNEQLPFCMLWVAVYLIKWVHVLSICADVRLFKKKKKKEQNVWKLVYTTKNNVLWGIKGLGYYLKILTFNLPDFWKQSFSTEKILWNSILLSRNCEIVTIDIYEWQQMFF